MVLVGAIKVGFLTKNNMGAGLDKRIFLDFLCLHFKDPPTLEGPMWNSMRMVCNMCHIVKNLNCLIELITWYDVGFVDQWSSVSMVGLSFFLGEPKGPTNMYGMPSLIILPKLNFTYKREDSSMDHFIFMHCIFLNFFKYVF